MLEFIFQFIGEILIACSENIASKVLDWIDEHPRLKKILLLPLLPLFWVKHMCKKFMKRE